MAALQVYSNSYVWYEYFVYVSFLTVISIIVVQIYLYITDYIQYINDKIDKMSKILSVQSEIIEKYNRKFIRFEEESIQCRISIQDHSQWISGISKEITGCENRIEKTEERVKSIIEHGISSLESKINNTNNDIYNIERNMLSIQETVRMIPDYVLIGYRYVDSNYNMPLPIFVPNDIKVDSEMLKVYQMKDCVLFINHFKYLKNMNYLNLNELAVHSFHKIRFSKCIDPIYSNNNTDIVTIKNTLLCPSNLGEIQLPSNRNYFKKGLLLLRSELLKINIKLVLNKDFEDFLC